MKRKTTMTFKIVADSSADLTALTGVDFASVPLTVMTSEHEYVDDAQLDVVNMLDELAKYKGRSHSSCPNPEDYIKAFGDADFVFCITITSGLSGSYNSAMRAAAEYTEAHPERKVHVIDSLSTGPENALLAERLVELINAGEDFDGVKEKITEYHKHTRLLFALESMHNLANNGRVSHLVAKLAGVLGIRAIGRASDVGTLEMICKSRGAAKAIADIVAEMAKEGYNGARAKIHHADNESAAKLLKEKIIASFKDAKVDIARARGLCSFYAERGGLLVGFEV